MDTPDPRAEARNRANRRLRRMTLGTAALGVASVGLFGATAAFTNDGSHPAADALALAVAGDAGSTSGDTTAPASTAATSPTTSTSSSSSATTPTVRSTSGSAQATTGGS